MCLPRGMRYSFISALSARITILRMPFTNPPISTRPSISVMTACSLGLRLEQLRDPRQTAGDVLGLGRLARDLGDDIGREDLGAVRHVEVRADRQCVPVTLGLLGRRLPLTRRADDDAGLELALRILDDHLAGETGDLVEL